MEVYIRDEFIRLGQALKLANLVSSGIEAKIVITNGEVLVNWEVLLIRGRKLRDGDMIKFNDTVFTIKNANW